MSDNDRLVFVLKENVEGQRPLCEAGYCLWHCMPDDRSSSTVIEFLTCAAVELVSMVLWGHKARK